MIDLARASTSGANDKAIVPTSYIAREHRDASEQTWPCARFCLAAAVIATQTQLGSGIGENSRKCLYMSSQIMFHCISTFLFKVNEND